MASAVKLGSTAISNAKLGSTQVSKIYQGTNLVWQQATGYNYVGGAYVIYDFGNPSSYGGSGATVYDVSGNSNNATLINSPSFSSNNGGIMDFTGASSQYMTYTGVIGAASTYMAIVKSKDANWAGYPAFPEARRDNGIINDLIDGSTDVGLFSYNGSIGPTALYDIWWSTTPNQWNTFSFSISNSSQKQYYNSSVKTVTNAYSRTDSASGTINVCKDSGIGSTLNGYLMGYLHYNFQLSDSEIAQNIAVFSSRF